MKILVTGANGFIGKNLVAELKNQGYTTIFEYSHESKPEELDGYIKECDFIFHLAGINRSETESDFMEGNYHFTSILLNKLKQYSNKAPILFSSSIQALLDNPYGNSKRAGENLLISYHKETGADIYLFRLQNVFGKWCRPNYNSVVATFCNNIANNLSISINDKECLIELIYIDDVVKTFIEAMNGNAIDKDGYYCVVPKYPINLGDLADIIYSFQDTRRNLEIPDMSDPFIKKLYSTYLSYLPINELSYSLNMILTNNGSFTEVIKTVDRGQVSVNILKAGITKGNHWHHTKIEKFLVVSGEGVIRFRKYGTREVIEYMVNGNKLEVIDIPAGYTHNITNIGESDLVTIMWANEAFDIDHPDTYPLKV